MSDAWSFALVGALVTLLATSLGALPALTKIRPSARAQDVLMGFSAGIMLAATCFSLLMPAVAMSRTQIASPVWAGLLTSAMVLVGGLFLHLCNEWIPHEHFVKGREGGPSGLHLKRIWLFVLAIALHNFPEGLAVGSGMGSLDPKIASPILIGIGLQDLPEGLVVAVALLSVQYTRRQAMMVTAVTGLVEAAAALLGAFATIQMQGILPWALAFAGGSMLYVVSDEIIPESHRSEFSKESTAGLMLGFVIMMFLDIALS